MKLSTALSHAQRIAERAHSVNGLLATPLTKWEAVRIRRLWVFGSTIKGKAEPGDVDILVDMVEVGRRRTWQQTRLDKYWRKCGMLFPPDSDRAARQWLRDGMKMVRFHQHAIDGNLIDKMVLLYPRNDLPAYLRGELVKTYYAPQEKEKYMDTNYYWHSQPDCDCCGRPHAPLHIGKSSGGWAFALHVIPEQGIHSLDDWRARWAMPGSFIRDDHGELVSVKEMERTITERTWRGQPVLHNLVDHRHCIERGPGTWDLITGEFS